MARKRVDGTHEARIQHVMTLMRTLVFRKGDTNKILQKQWGLTEDTVKFICAEASTRVCSEVADPGEVERDVGVALSEGIRLARERGDWKTVGDLCRIYASISIARPSQKAEEGKKTAATPKTAAAAVKGFFGDNVTNDPKQEDVTGRPESEGCTPSDGTGSP